MQESDHPFYDLLKLIQGKPLQDVLDVGCGNGYFTQLLHDSLNAKSTYGVDISPEAINLCQRWKTDKLTFECADILTYSPSQQFDLIFSYSTFQWLAEHRKILTHLSSLLKKEGQLAIQMPANFDGNMHAIVKAEGESSAFKKFVGDRKLPSILSVEEYSTLLYDLGFQKQVVRLEVYPLIFASKSQLLEWIKMSLKSNVEIHTERTELKGTEQPLFIPFKRMLIWASK